MNTSNITGHEHLNMKIFKDSKVADNSEDLKMSFAKSYS